MFLGQVTLIFFLSFSIFSHSLCLTYVDFAFGRECCDGEESFRFINIFFKKKMLEDTSSFCRATDTPVLDFWWCLLCVSKLGGIPSLYASSPVSNGFLRFTTGATPADLLTASMAAGRVPYMHVAEVGAEVHWHSLAVSFVEVFREKN